MNRYTRNLISWSDEQINEEAYKIREGESEIFNELDDVDDALFYMSGKYEDFLYLIMALDKIIFKLKEYFYERTECLDKDSGYEDIVGLAPEDYPDYNEKYDESVSLMRDAYDKFDNLEYNLDELIKIRNTIDEKSSERFRYGRMIWGG